LKVRLDKNLELVITPESYVEQVALRTWSESKDQRILVDAFVEEELEPVVGHVVDGILVTQFCNCDFCCQVRAANPKYFFGGNNDSKQ
jgi:hypothetical protein